jgi:hypothetical protein
VVLISCFHHYYIACHLLYTVLCASASVVVLMHINRLGAGIEDVVQGKWHTNALLIDSSAGCIFVWTGPLHNQISARTCSACNCTIDVRVHVSGPLLNSRCICSHSLWHGMCMSRCCLVYLMQHYYCPLVSQGWATHVHKLLAPSGVVGSRGCEGRVSFHLATHILSLRSHYTIRCWA